MSSSNITITVRGEQAVKEINYSDPALGNSVDCSDVDYYKEHDKINIKVINKNNDRDNYNNKDIYKEKDLDKDKVKDKDKDKDKDNTNNNDKKK